MDEELKLLSLTTPSRYYCQLRKIICFVQLCLLDKLKQRHIV